MESTQSSFHKINFRYLIGFPVLILFLIICRENRFLFFIIFSLLTAYINYITNHPRMVMVMLPMWLNIDIEVMGSLIITRLVGLPYAVFMIFCPNLISDVISARLDKDTFLSYFFTAFICLIMSFFPAENFVNLALVLVTFRLILMMFIFRMIGVSFAQMIFEHMQGYVCNLVMIFTLAEPIIRFFR